MKPVHKTKKSLHKKSRRIVQTLQRVVALRWERRRVTYQCELIQCGKPRCSKWHGPYWYAYWYWAERQRSRYVGKVRRDLTLHELRAIERGPEKAAAERRARAERRAAEKQQQQPEEVIAS